MKKILVTATIVAMTVASAKAQEIPDRKRGEFKPVERERVANKKELASLNLTDEQKEKFKTMNQDFRQKLNDLKKQDNLTVKEYRERMETLHKDHMTQFQSILTPEQRTQMEKDKEGLRARAEEHGKKRLARMKQELNLTDEQSAKMEENRKATAEKIRATRENSSLSDEQKREQVRDLMKQQKETIKSVLSKEQLEKLKETRKQRGKKEVI